MLSYSNVRRAGQSGAINSPVINAVAVVVILASALAILLSQCRHPNTINPEPLNEVGVAAFQETARLLGNRGRIVLVVPRRSGMAAMNAPLRAFQDAIGKQSALVIVATEESDAPPINAYGPAPEPVWPASQFLALLAKHPNADAVVSFVGAPVLSDDDYTKVPATMPKLVTVSLLTWPARRLIERGIVTSAVVPRTRALEKRDSDASPAPVSMGRTYMVVTAESVASLPP